MQEILTSLQALGYIGAFLISMLGTLTIIFPLPYLIMIYIMGNSGKYNPVLLGIAGGLGATIGEFVLYILARAGRLVLSYERRKNLEIISNYLDKYGAIIVFLFAATPLPDDILYPVMGLIKYNAIYLFIACFAGKALLTGGIAYAGELSLNILSYISGTSSLPMQIGIIIIIIILIIIILKIDWNKIFTKIAGVKN